jgi:hypothetical protein
LRQRFERGRQPAVGEHLGWMPRAKRRSSSMACSRSSAGSCERVSQFSCSGIGCLPPETSELQRDTEQLLLHAIVEIPFEAASSSSTASTESPTGAVQFVELGPNLRGQLGVVQGQAAGRDRGVQSSGSSSSARSCSRTAMTPPSRVTVVDARPLPVGAADRLAVHIEVAARVIRCVEGEQQSQARVAQAASERLLESVTVRVGVELQDQIGDRNTVQTSPCQSPQHGDGHRRVGREVEPLPTGSGRNPSCLVAYTWTSSTPARVPG